MKRQIYHITSREKPVLVDFLAEQLSLSKKKAKQILDERRVFVNQKRVWMAKHELKQGDTVEVMADAGSATEELKALYRDDHYLIVDKPPALLSNGKDSVEALLQKQLKSSTIQAVHRLDRDTTGCLLFAKSEKAKEVMVPLFEDHKVMKIYRAIVEGRVDPQSNRITRSIDGKQAVTEFQIQATSKVATLLKVRISTGRTHQIRKHFSSIGHPILGDKEYGASKVESTVLRSIPRQMLHAERLSFTSPMDHRKISCAAPLPRDFKACLKKVGLG